MFYQSAMCPKTKNGANERSMKRFGGFYNFHEKAGREIIVRIKNGTSYGQVMPLMFYVWVCVIVKG